MTEFVSRGMRRSEFYQSRDVSFSTLDRHLKKRQWKSKNEKCSRKGPVEYPELELSAC